MILKINALTGLCAALFAFCPRVAPASTECANVSFSTESNVNFSSNPVQQMSIEVKRSGNKKHCDYFLAFSRGYSSSYDRVMAKGSDTTPYQLYRAFPYVDVVKDVADAVSNSDVIAGSFAEGSSVSMNLESYRAVLGNAAYKPVGLYSDSVTIRLYEGTLSSYTLKDSKTVLFTYSSTRSIDLSLVSSGAAFDPNSTGRILNFGTMSPGQSMGFDLVLKTNAGYSVSATSLNGGVMKHLSAESTVPYAMSVQGTSVSLNGGAMRIASGNGASPSGGSRIPIAITIGSIGSSVSGNYRDDITLTVQTTE